MRAIASPSVRKLAATRGVDIDALAQRLGRTAIAREDVLDEPAPAAAEAHRATGHWDVDHAAWGPVRVEKRSRMAEVASVNLTAAQQMIPAVTHHASADLSRIEATRAKLRAEGQRITSLAFHVAILARCLKAFPRFNAALSADGHSLILKEYIHIGIAVDTPHGLSVPVIRNADRMRIVALGQAIADLADRAKARKLRPHDIGGASMTISNLGGIGGAGFTPIVNPPEVAILGISALATKPVWTGTAFQPRPMVPLDLSYDHRVINGAEAARFLKQLCALIGDPDQMLLAPD